jgi:hypothetical protein
MLYETRDEAGRGQASLSPGQAESSAVTDASADTRELGGANVSTSMKQIAPVDNALSPRQKSEPGLATGRVSSKKLKVDASVGSEVAQLDVRKSPLSAHAFQTIGAGLDDRGQYPPLDPVRLQQQALPLGVDKPYELSSEHRLGVFAVPMSEYGEWGVLQFDSYTLGPRVEWTPASKESLGMTYLAEIVKNHRPCIITLDRFLRESGTPLNVQTVIASDGTAVDVMFLPPNASARHSTMAKMREYMVNVFEIEPSKYSAIRTAFTGCPDRVPELDGWLGDKASTPLEDHLRASTATVLADLLRLHKSFAVVVDDTHPYPAAYALGTKAVAGMVRLVSGMVQNGDLDEPSELKIYYTVFADLFPFLPRFDNMGRSKVQTHASYSRSSLSTTDQVRATTNTTTHKQCSLPRARAIASCQR